jgi:UDP-N-acetylmuramoyl-L-alanyl-D-glutamate--2,6-diaminopimelate ligase
MPSAPRVLAGLVDRLGSSGQLVSVRSPTRLHDLAVSGIAYDSHKVGPGSVFAAISGAHADGHDFVESAEAAGALAVIVEREIPAARTVQIVVKDSRLALAVAAAWWSGDPSLELGIVGVTGTDGKTTVSFLATAVLGAAGISTGLITTAAVKIGPETRANPEHVTTPQAPELQATLRQMVGAGNEAAVVETTSHGLALHRVAEIAFDVAIFTNLTHEHLELHGTFEAYRAAKLSLFTGLGRGPSGAPFRKSLARRWPSVAVVNADDPSAPLFVDAARAAGAGVITYGLATGTHSPTPAPDVSASEISEDVAGLAFLACTPRWRDLVTIRLAGRFNVGNALAAIALGEALALDPPSVRRGLAELPGVPGRMERIDMGQPFGVVVDYAHSPAALEKVLDILAPNAAPGAGLIAVFGSAGERDVQKRSVMGRIAGERCRIVIITDEDPRGEDRLAIIDEIASGAEAPAGIRGHEVLRIADRPTAIARAFERARPGDVVVLAGKGHEQSIITADGPIPWDETAEAVKALATLGFGAGRQGEGPQTGDRSRCDPA